ncbi:FAD/NAD(P)-binding domain-containing protein [Aspergillus sclerotioniger CBS 115572]|uniref:FAD/NAD(P)-binding domain-containing protein n=1 Tax=Aspergillus sclerotioniger CBS 115572 TaxID=1450535 RepID=A0A317WZ74_9EURO|nr:FAD/NAD(P)-binding domain-containing protein [Aspergillus sclerotioniger CBS 115572]PWY91315.1 FAD/NAD(P)-binding domain-containing protein [Aspergillus sclerotioniger CBS 115572]
MIARHPLPIIDPGLVDPGTMVGGELNNRVRLVVDRFNAAMGNRDVEGLGGCLDELAFTYHLRTFFTAEVIAEAMLETGALRGFIPAAEKLQFIECGFVFRTVSPAAACKGKMVLLPVRNGDTIEWKIWVLVTVLSSLDMYPEDESLLRSPGRSLDGLETFETDVFIIGGGNAAIALSARLKALGVESVMAERNPHMGDNWALRYDSLRFHIPAACCDLPYLPYEEHLRGKHFLRKDELAAQVRRYVAAFNLNCITSAQIQSTHYDVSAQRWKIRFQTPEGQRTAVTKHLVLAKGHGSQKPRMPVIADRELYQGISIHSTQYRNATQLREQGAKSALVIGSANTAFDVMEDCHAAGLQTTMIARSRTYIIPVEHLSHPLCLGSYQFGVDAADWRFVAIPILVGGQLAKHVLGQLASQEPHRYDALTATGFGFMDSRHPDASFIRTLYERAGGHYVDMGGTKLLAEGKVEIKPGVQPVGYTATGLRLSDASCVDADAVVWCTGFADANVRDDILETLGEEDEAEKNKQVLGPHAIAARVDATWGLDTEGELRGMFKRHLRLENFWIMGGFTQQHRWHSRTLAFQIKAALEGVLPPAYRDTPQSKSLNNRESSEA